MPRPTIPRIALRWIMRAICAIAVAASACGRVGFENTRFDGPSDVPPDEIAVLVGRPDAPIAGATVFVDGGEVLYSDETGLARIHTTSSITFHVLFDISSSYFLYSVLDVGGGTLVRVGQLGGSTPY